MRANKVMTAASLVCGETDKMKHFITCPGSTVVTAPLMHCIQSNIPGITATQVTCLEVNAPDSVQLPLVWLIAIVLDYTWERRKAANRDFLQGELLAIHSLFTLATKFSDLVLNDYLFSLQ